MRKKALIGFGILLLIILVTWAICETQGSEYYNYKGYITDIFENENGETVIVTLSGTKEAEHTVKWYTRKKAPQKTPFCIGDHVMLTSTRFGDNTIKKIKVEPGYSTEGKWIRTESNAVFVLAISKDTNTRYLVNIVAQNDICEGLKSGDTVKIYHTAPLRYPLPTAIADSALLIAPGTPDSLTAEDIDFIESQGHQLKTEQ